VVNGGRQAHRGRIQALLVLEKSRPEISYLTGWVQGGAGDAMRKGAEHTCEPSTVTAMVNRVLPFVAIYCPEY
jgi:hypothetical protein